MDNFERLLQSFGESTGIGQIVPGPDRAVQLIFDQHVVVYLQPDRSEKYLAIYSVVGLVGHNISLTLLRELMSASLFGCETNGASFAFEPMLGQVVLQRTERLDGLTYSDFEQMLQTFVDSAEEWKKRLTPHAADENFDRVALLPDSEPADPSLLV